MTVLLLIVMAVQWCGSESNIMKHRINVNCPLAWTNMRHLLSQFLNLYSWYDISVPVFACRRVGVDQGFIHVSYGPFYLLLCHVRHWHLIGKLLAFYLLIKQINDLTILPHVIFFVRVQINVSLCTTFSGHSMWWWFHIAKRQTLQNYCVCHYLGRASRK